MNPLFTLVSKRLLLGTVTLFVISMLIFMGVEALPGDLAEAILGQYATPETIAAMRLELKLDLPSYTRYFNWLTDFLQGDMGTSLSTKKDVADVIGWRLGNTFFLAISAAVISIPLAVVLGLFSALYRNSLFDRLVSIFSLAAISVPEFFIAYILIAIFSVQFPWFTSVVSPTDEMSFFEKLYEIILPCFTLTFVVLAHMMRMTRAAIINILSSPFIEMAQLKGCSRLRIIVKHALPNALSPVITVIALNLAYLIVGVVIVEVVFAYPGMGAHLVEMVHVRDLPVIQATALIFAGTYILLNLAADILSIVFNPKLHYRKNSGSN